MALSKQEKFEKKKQKLLQKNARLQSKKNKLKDEQNDNDTSSNTLDEMEWNELIKLLSTKDLVLRPQILFEYLALLIQSFAGSNIIIALNRNAHILGTLSSSNNYKSIINY